METTTVGAERPLFTVLEGHHDLQTFQKASVREGRERAWSPDEISHEYWRKNFDGTWEFSTNKDPLAIPVTVGEW